MGLSEVRLSKVRLSEVLAELESLGTAQNRKIYARHGIRSDMYGVSYANFGKFSKRIQVDHELALGLWETGNHDARILATMVADPEKFDPATLEAWVTELDNYVLTDAFSGLVGRTPSIRRFAEKWRRSKEEWLTACGWNLTGMLAEEESELPDSYFEECLRLIETKIHRSPNRGKHSMNQALIQIGVRNAGLHRKAVAAAGRIGDVEVEHGETSCRTPHAIPYMNKMLAHRAKQSKKVKATAKPAKEVAKKRASVTKKKTAKTAKKTNTKNTKKRAVRA